MAQALSVVGEAGIHGMEYNAMSDMLINRPSRRQPIRFRVSPVAAHRFSAKEFEDYLILAWRFGLVERTNFKEVEWLADKNKSSYQIEDEIVRLTREGWEYVEENDQPLLHRWGRQVAENVPAIFVGIVIAISGRSILDWLGYSQ